MRGSPERVDVIPAGGKGGDQDKTLVDTLGQTPLRLDTTLSAEPADKIVIWDPLGLLGTTGNFGELRGTSGNYWMSV